MKIEKILFEYLVSGCTGYLTILISLAITTEHKLGQFTFQREEDSILAKWTEYTHRSEHFHTAPICWKKLINIRHVIAFWYWKLFVLHILHFNAHKSIKILIYLVQIFNCSYVFQADAYNVGYYFGKYFTSSVCGWVMFHRVCVSVSLSLCECVCLFSIWHRNLFFSMVEHLDNM